MPKKTGHWDIEYEGELLAYESEARRALRRYIANRPGPHLTQPQAIAEILIAYEQLVSAKFGWTAPHAATDGSNSLIKGDNE